MSATINSAFQKSFVTQQVAEREDLLMDESGVAKLLILRTAEFSPCLSPSPRRNINRQEHAGRHGTHSAPFRDFSRCPTYALNLRTTLRHRSFDINPSSDKHEQILNFDEKIEGFRMTREPMISLESYTKRNCFFYATIIRPFKNALR
jgi:hypothetical protein